MHDTKPSMTARKVALNLVTLGAKPEMAEILPNGIVDATAELLVASGTVSEIAIKMAHSRQAVSIYEAFDWMLPGQFEAFGYRKAFCERQVRDGIGNGITQILVLGAGYDTMGWRLAPKFPGVNFLEIDHPATADVKARGINAMGQRDNLCLIAADLGGQKLIDVLEGNKLWKKSVPAVIIAEGLVMYLSAEAVMELFCQCAAITGRGSRIAFSYIPSGEDGNPYVGRWTGLMLWLQEMVGEPWIWSVLPEQLDSFLGETGWTNAQDLAGIEGKVGVEYLVVATR